MKITLGELRFLLRESAAPVELQRPTFKDDSVYSRFLKEIVPTLKAKGALPAGVGQVLDSGFEGAVCSLGSDRVIKLIPTYDAPAEFSERHVGRLKRAPSGGAYVKIFDAGAVKAHDPKTNEVYTVLVYVIMERLEELSSEEARIIFDVVNEGEMDVEDVENELLKSFLEFYMSLSHLAVDHDVRNVMKRDDQYVIIDP